MSEPVAPIDEDALQLLLSRNKAIFDWCVRSARRQLKRGRAEKAAQWCAVAAFLADGPGWFGTLADPSIEDVLLQIAGRIPKTARPRVRQPRDRWLHVITMTAYWGGMVANLKKWIRFTKNHAVNDVAVLEQTNAAWLVPLTEVVENAGGRVYSLRGTSPLTERARVLRSLATERANAVVLHTRPFDVVPALAFGVRDGPPVFRYNVDDHMFWTGVPATDLVLNFRELGERLTVANRGIDRSMVLPLPMEEPAMELDAARKPVARSRFGIPAGATVLLSVGDAYKFHAVDHWDFLKAAGSILARCPNAHILAAGISPDARWRDLSAAFQGRLQALGAQTDLTDCHAASDIGLGSIPFPSQTAILESAFLGRPCVLTPLDVPLGINDPSFDGFAHPVTMADYIEFAVQLVQQPALRAKQGAALAHSVRKHHGQDRWLSRWASLQSAKPRHELYPLRPVMPMSDAACDFWSKLKRLPGEDVIRHIHYNIITRCRGLWPAPDPEMARFPNARATKPAWWTAVFCLRGTRFHLGGMKRSLRGYLSNDNSVSS